MKLDEAFLRALGALAEVRTDEPLSRHTTIGIGGPADAYAVATEPAQLKGLLGVCRDAGVPFFVLGSGSNIVVGDDGIRGLVIENKSQPVSEPAALPAKDGEAPRFLVQAGAGCSFALLARQMAFAGFQGLEWACGIPGTVGGAVVYNAGAYGGCLADVLEAVEVWDPEAGAIDYPAADLGMVYRGSAFTRGMMAGRAVLGIDFALWRGDEAELRERVKDYDSRRLKAQPRGRNAGSFFKNPGQPAWKLLEGVGMRGYQIGGAQFSDKHCNFLINAGDATAADVSALKRLAQQRVRDEYGIELENEVTFVGEGFGGE